MLDWVPSAPYTAEQLLEVLRILRDPENGCPWDKVQTHASIRKKLDDAVRSCLYDLMITAGKQDDTREFDHTIIQCGDGFHIQVVCRLIKD